MSTIQLYLSALHTNITQSNCHLDLDVQAAQQHIAQMNQYFKSDITSIESELALKILFTDDKGIVKYAKIAISLDSINTREIISDILFLCLQLIESFPTKILNYIRSIMDVCTLCIVSSKKNADISIKIYQIYEKLLKSNNLSDQIKIVNIIEHLNNEVSLGDKVAATVRQHIYNLFGVIAQHHPMYLINYTDKLMNLFCYELQNQIDTREKNVRKFLPPVAIGCLNGLTGFLNNFEYYLGKRDYFIRLYEILKKLIGDVEEKKRHVINRTSLNLFQKHIQLFLKLLFQNSAEIIWFQKNLWNWCLFSNIEDKKIGLSSFETFYKGASLKFSRNSINIEPNINNAQRELIKIMIVFLKSKLYDHKLNFQEHGIVVRSIGWLSEPCNNFLGEENLNEIFTILSQQADEKYLNEFEKKMFDPNAANYLNSLSLFIRNIKFLNSDQLLSVQKLSIYCFNDFVSAESNSEWKINICNALLTSIYCVALSHEHILNEYLNNLFYAGLIKSCLHRAAIDADIIEECTGHIIIKSINYVPLWISLLKAHQCHSFDLYLNIPISVKSILEKSLMSSFMYSVLKIIKKLDLFTDKSPNKFEIKYVARKPSDFTALVNLVHIYSEILDSLELDIETLLLWLPYTLNKIINYSIELPTVSSLYRMLTIIFQKLDICLLLENNNSIKEIIIDYVYTVMKYVHTFKSDTQFCCLEMFMNLPSTIIKEIFDNQILDIVKASLIVGSTFLPLARSTINAVKKWQQDLSENDRNQLLKCIMPYLDLFLRTKGYDNEVELDNSTLNQIQVQNNKKQTLIKQNKLIIKSETELEIIQTQIIEFLAQLDMNFCLQILKDLDDMSYPSNIINYKLSFNDCKINICFDHLLPRILELCQYCSNRQIRFIACETFHSYIILYLGNNLILERSKPTEMEMLTTKIIPIVLKLACDMDNLVQQLFEPLAIGIVHYFASGVQYNSIYTPIIIDILMDYTTDNSNETVRDFSAKCIMEFINWASKEDDPDQKHSISLRMIINKIEQFCKHSDPNKQLGAAIAFNSCYIILRENETIINELWIQLLYYFVIFLDSAKSVHSQEHVLKSIDHLHRVFLEKSNLFNEICPSRKILKQFHGMQLFNIVEWLLKYIGSPIANCRSKCFNMVNSLSKNVKDHNSLKSVLNSFIITHGEEELINCFERDLISFINFKNVSNTPYNNSLNVESITCMLVNWLTQLSATLDCYTSLFKENMIDIKLLKSPFSSLLQAINHFLFQIEEVSLIQWLTNLNKPYKKNDKNIIIQSRNINFLKNEVVIGLFQFINLFDNDVICVLLDVFNQKKIYKLAVRYIFEYDIICSFEKSNLFKSTIIQYIKNVCTLNIFCNKLKQYLTDKWSKVISNLHALPECTVENNFICGNQLLLKNNISQSVDQKNIVKRKYILEIIFKYIYNDGMKVNFEPTILLYLENLIDFLINLDYKDDIITLLVMDNKFIIDSNTQQKLIFGQYFFKLFNKPITKYYLKIPKTFVDIFFNKYPLSDQTFNVIIEVIKTSKNKQINEQGQMIIEKIVNNINYWEQFQHTFSWNVIYEFVELSSNIINTFKSENFIFLRKWICENLLNNNLNIYHKCRLLGLLPKLISNQINEDSFDIDLSNCLIDFRDKYFLGTSSKLKSHSINFTNLVTVFQKILTAMEMSSSHLLFKIIIEWCIKDPNDVCIKRVENSLNYFFKRLTDQSQLLCFKFIYEQFRNEIISEDRRQMIINIFLIPIISYCRKNVVTIIYTDIIDFILKTVNENFLANDSRKARHLLISKIACFKLIEELFRFFTNIELNSDTLTTNTLFGSQSNNLISKFRTAAVKVRYSNVDYRNGSKEIKQLFRQLHCSSYNALITIINNTEHEDSNKYTIFLFNERPPKQFIWRNLVDCSIHYEFPIDFETIPHRKKKLINIRTKYNQSIPEIYINLNSHLKNTLSEDLENYDYSSSYLRSSFIENLSSNPPSLNQNISVELEMDIFNNHECMAHLCAVINYLTSENVIDTTIKPNMEMPDWMKSLKTSFSDNSCDIINSKILILKLIINCETNFKPYAKHWLSPIMEFILDKHLGDNLNYFICDVVSMLISWHTITVPSTENEKYLANKLLCFLLSVSHSEVKTIFKHNIELIKFVIENWKCSLEVDYDLCLSLLKPNNINDKSIECGLHLIGIVSANGILPFNELTKNNFLNLLIEFLKNNNHTIYILTSEILGMLLKILNENSINELNLLQSVTSVLKLYANLNVTKVLSCLYSIHKHYSSILNGYIDNLFDIFEKLQGIHRTQCLEMFLDKLSIIHNSYEKLTKLQCFFNILKDNGTDDQLLCLKIILQLIPSLYAEELIILIKIISKIYLNNSIVHRRLIYDIMSRTYEYHLGNNTDTSKQIIEECKKILLNGLVDTDEELRQNIFRFWTDDKRLPVKFADRFLILLNELYSPDIDSHFLGNLVSILLESCCTTLDYDQKIFQYPLHACKFDEYKLTVSWRTKNISTTPKYADTILSQLNQSNIPGYSEFDILQRNQIKRTLTLQFQSTIAQTQLMCQNISILESSSHMSINEVNMSSLNSVNQQIFNQNSDSILKPEADFIQKKNVRILRNKSIISKQFALQNIQTITKREIFKKERAQKLESSVNIYRKYRIGDFPDIEITNASVIKPLIELSKRDNNIARVILSSIMYELKKYPKNDQQYYESLNKSLINMINHCHCNPPLVGFILDTAYCYPMQINLNIHKITEVAKACGLMSLGALVIETSINNLDSNKDDLHVVKKSKTIHKFPDDSWMKLAEIYKNIGELDVVEGIFQDKINSLSCTSLKEALKAEQSDDWRIAQMKYKSALECNESNIFLENDKNFLFEEYYKCSEHLSDWTEINNILKLQTGENYKKIWECKDYKEHLLSRILHCELDKISTGISDGQFIETFNNWLNDKPKEEYILTHVAVQACMIFLCCDDINKAQLWCKLRMHNFLKEWGNISPQYYKLRVDRLLNIQTLSEIYYFIKLISIQSRNNSEEIKKQIQTWQSNLPVNSDSLILWDVKLLYRSFFINKINTSINELPFEEQPNLKQILNKYEVESMLALIENAINKKNVYVAKKYMNECRFENIENCKSNFILCRSQIIAMSSDYITDIEKKLKCYLKSWSELDDIIEENCSSICMMKIHLHIANISKNISNVIHGISDISVLSNNLKLVLMNKLKSNIQFGCANEILKKTDYMIIKNLKSGIYIALNNNLSTETIIDTYLILAQYCLKELNYKENTKDNKKYVLFIESVLKAMKYGAKKASELFPIILQFENLSDNMLKETFILESQNVPEYMFLQWINQILGCLDSPFITVIGPLLIRISKVYPKAIQLPLKIYMEKDVYNNEQCEEFLNTKIIPLIYDIYMDMFVKAICNVCCPFNQLLEYINNIEDCIKTNCLNKIILKFENLFKNCFITEENQEFKGKEFKKLDIYKNNLKVILDQLQSSVTNINNAYLALEVIRKQVCFDKEKYYNTKQSTNLIHYCPWLTQYSNHSINNLEVPGQYFGFRKPNLDSHITITSFQPNVQVMCSMRNPIKITIIGNNGKLYSFLIKFGEDLRQDQRIEQLLQIMNNTLCENVYCCERQLSLLTYAVLPISKNLGMIEWINNTVTLKDFICESLSDDKESGIKLLHSKNVEYNQWLSKKSSSSSILIIYKQASIEYNKMVTAAKFKQLVQSIPPDILRKSLLNMCHCAEMYVCLRSKFITSYSVLSICHWLLGIGDRHLNNTIVSTKTGHCIGIDFSFVFHTATSIQIIPELIPFRMSPHIVSLMAPLNLTGFIRETMVHTLKTLIDNQEILLSVMQVFINDPSADWVKMAKTENLKIDGDFNSKEIQWFPKTKIATGKDKMNGVNPIEILSRELKNSSIPNDYKNALLNILKSDSQNNTYKRSILSKCNITPNQQIDCLLDIATDEHILGKAYGGLELWI